MRSRRLSDGIVWELPVIETLEPSVEAVGSLGPPGFAEHPVGPDA